MKIIGLSGYARSGKDTVANILVSRGFEGRRVHKLAFADPMREIERWYRGDLGRLREDNPECYRSDMQFLGRFMRDIDPDIWVTAASNHIRFFPKTCCLVISDVRYPNEMDWVFDRGGEIWWIDNPRATKINDHESEQHYETIARYANRIIDNSGTLEELEEAVVRLGDGRTSSQVDEDSLPGGGGPGE